MEQKTKELELYEIFELGAVRYCIAEYDGLVLKAVDGDGVIFDD